MYDLAELEERLDDATLQLVIPLRTAARGSKSIDQRAYGDVIAVMDELAEALWDKDAAPRRLVGKMLFVFEALMGESNHASDPHPIADAAWEVFERIVRIFGSGDGLDGTHYHALAELDRLREAGAISNTDYERQRLRTLVDGEPHTR
jgi:hypothetical protein